MAVGNLHDYGEEYYLRTGAGDLSPVSSFTIFLYDSSDALTESSDIGSITTEPGNTNYSRQSVQASNITFAQVSGDVEDDYPNVTFDLSDNSTSNTVDSYGIIFNAALTVVASDGGTATDHILATGSLDQSYTLSNVDNLQVNDVGGSLT